MRHPDVHLRPDGPTGGAAAVLFFINEKPLATAVEHDVLSESNS